MVVFAAPVGNFNPAVRQHIQRQMCVSNYGNEKHLFKPPETSSEYVEHKTVQTPTYHKFLLAGKGQKYASDPHNNLRTCFR